MRHETRVSPATEEASVEKFQAEVEGWDASCSCGWEANNPLPDEYAALEASKDHEQARRDDPEQDFDAEVASLHVPFLATETQLGGVT